MIIKLKGSNIFSGLGNISELGQPYSVTVTCATPGATIKIEAKDMTTVTSTSGTATMSNIPYGTRAYYTVSAEGYTTKTGSTVSGGNISVTLTAVNTGGGNTGGDTPTQPTTYTFTINPTPSTATVTLTASGYTQSGNSITVPANTVVTWKVSATGYTQQTGTHTVTKTESKSVALSENSSTPVSGTLFDFDFTTSTIEDYVNSGVITLPSGSDTTYITYSSKGLSTSSTTLPAALQKGVKLSNAFELSSQSWTFEITMTMDTYDSDSMGPSVTEALYPNLAFFSSAEHGTLEDGKAHGSNCLSPAIYINGGKFSGRFPDQGGVTTGSSTKLFNADSIEHTYKWVYDKSTNTNTIFVDGVQQWTAAWTRTDYEFGGSMQYLLGVHDGYSSGKNFCIKKGMHIKNMKMYTN